MKSKVRQKIDELSSAEENDILRQAIQGGLMTRSFKFEVEDASDRPLVYFEINWTQEFVENASIEELIDTLVHEITRDLEELFLLGSVESGEGFMRLCTGLIWGADIRYAVDAPLDETLCYLLTSAARLDASTWGSNNVVDDLRDMRTFQSRDLHIHPHPLLPDYYDVSGAVLLSLVPSDVSAYAKFRRFRIEFLPKENLVLVSGEFSVRLDFDPSRVVVFSGILPPVFA